MHDIDIPDLSLDDIREEVSRLRLNLEKLLSDCRKKGGPTVADWLEIEQTREVIKHGEAVISAKRSYEHLHKRLVLPPARKLEARVAKLSRPILTLTRKKGD